MSNAKSPDLSLTKQVLVERLQALRDASSSTVRDREPVELDQSSVGRLSRIDSLQMQQMALAAERRREVDILRSEAAIRRIEKGEYGFCIVCEEPIAQKRLDADPAVPTCLQCAAKTGQ